LEDKHSKIMEEKLTLENLPRAVHQLFEKVINIEKILLSTLSNVPQADQLLSITEAAELLKLKISTLYSLNSCRAIPFSKVGKRLYYSRIDLIEWVKSGRNKTNSEIEANANSYLQNRKSRKLLY
jgi:excisionase family DNA binding protein